MLLVLAMVMTVLPFSAFAATKGDLADVSTGLTGDIDTGDTISLPIKILDYEADGMLFEFAEANAGVSGVGAAKTAKDFGATWAEDYTTRTSVGGSINTGNYWADVSLALKTGTYANYTRMTWAGNTTANWTGNRAGVVMADFSDSSTYTTDQVRYMVVVFRSNVRSGSFTVGLNRANLNGAGTSGNYTGNIAVTTENNTNWTYAVLDLKTGTLGSNWSKGAVYGVYVGLPISASGNWMDLAHVAFFSNKDQATAFGEYALTDGSDRGDNRGFGLLRSSRNQSGGINYAGILDETSTVEQMYTYGDTTSIDFSTLTTLGYTLLGTFADNGIANVGMLQSGLSSEGYPVYKEEVVTYVAKLLQHSLEISERTSDGWKNYRYIKGTASSVYGGTDLATALRTKINKNLGSYAAASGKDLIGTWAEVGGNIASYYDAAYFLLNSIFIPGSYNVPQDDYNYLILSAGTDSQSGDKTYVFDGGFTATSKSTTPAINYNTNDKTIQNSSAAYKSHFYYDSSNTTTLNPFLPITDRNNETGMTKTPYYQDDGVINGVKGQTTKDTLFKRNFGFAMVSEGEFVYHADDELFFEFEGDDDVYLFINGELVMDIGSAHSIDGVRFALNDYVNAAKAGTLGSDARNKALALEEGNTYSFEFYYMERHSYGSNIRISTNIRVTDPSMTTAKSAWQDGTQLDFGSIVDKDKVVEYGFAITNNGQENLYNLTFTDNDIGVTLDPTKGLNVSGSRVSDVNGGTLEATDLTATVTHPNYDDINVTFADNAALKKFLADLTASGTEAGAGLFIGATVQIRGIGYKLSDAQIKAGVFDNTVLTTSTNKTESETLHGQATMRVFVPADPMYYEWAGHELKVTKAKLIEDILAAANTEGNMLAGKVPNLTTNNVSKIELVTKGGTAITSPYVSIDGSYNLTIKYPDTGSKVFYVKITSSAGNVPTIPVLVNVTDVEDSVFVLDYGLKVELTEGTELFKNDTLTVPGRTTSYSIIAMGTKGDYANNEITFSSANPVDGAYGTFEKSEQTITYTPSEFIEGMDTVQIAVNVYESDATPSNITGTLNINDEVEMYKNVHVLPANVVYYEDDFPAITYTDTEATTQDNTNSFVSLGTQQSNDQDQEYGQDNVYETETEDEFSGGSLTTIAIDSSTKVASFTFKGTGFELIGRTNADDSATLIVKVLDSTGKTIKTLPVITEFDNEDNEGNEEIYQVPVIRVKDLSTTAQQYTVEISGVPANTYDENGNKTGTKTTYLYVDGLRIYQPVEGDQELENNYNETEQDAQFIELRDQIVQGCVAVVNYTESDGITVSTATSTWTENLSGENEGELEFNEVDSVDDYLLEGPNNEVYMNGTYDNAALVFYVKDNNGNDVSSLQLALRAIDETLFMSGIEGTANATVRVGVYNGTTYAWEDVLVNSTSSTEQYYSIDYTKCYFDTDKGAYQVVVRVDEGMASYSSLKLTGLELVSVDGPAATLKYNEGTLVQVTNQQNDDSTDDDINGSNDNNAETINSDGDDRIISATFTEVTAPVLASSGYEPADEAAYVNFASVKAQMASTILVSDTEEEEETEPTDPEVDPSEPETDPSEPEDEDAQPGYGGSNRNEMIKKIIKLLKKFWGFG